MDRDEGKNFAGNDSMFTGAIFMSNHKTKQECLNRKLFGLPASQAGFLKKVKAGMLLFLFEYEERKLHGVFEATSDGALNIMPNAFISSGKFYPAQILFKRIWMCKPLSEDEFHDAIKDNYYMPYKFHFGLSYEQVYRLIQLFYLKKISLTHYRKPGIPNIKGRFNRFHSDENTTDHDIDSSRCPGRIPRAINRSMYYKGDVLTSGNSVVGVERGSSLTVLHDTKPLTNLMRSSLQNYPVPRGSFPSSPSRDLCDYGMLPGFGRELCSASLGMRPCLDQEHTAHVRSPVATLDPLFRDVSRSHDICKGSSLRSSVPSNVSLPFIASECHANLHDYKDASFPDSYNPFPTTTLSTPGIVANKGTYSSPSVHGPSYAHGYPEASQKEDHRRGQWCLDLGSSADYIPLSQEDDEDYYPISADLVKNTESSQLPSSPPKDEFDVQYCYNSESEEENEELKHDEEYYPISANPKLQSDTDQRRISVFSRLSRAPEPREHYVEPCKPDTSLSLEQLLEMLSQRRDRWGMNPKAEPKLAVIHLEDKQMEDITEMEQSAAAYLGELESSSEAITEESSVLPLLNFKRRSEVRKMEHGTETNGHVVGGEDEGKCKRRRLVRPSFSEEERRHVHRSSQEIVGADVFVKNGVGKSAENVPLKTKSAENVSSVRSYEDSGPSLVNVGTDRSVKNIEGSRNCRSGISNGNARWSLLKSIIAEAKASIGDPDGKQQKANNASHAVSSCEVSLLPVHSECGDQETGGVDKGRLEDNIESADFLSLEVGED